MTPSPENSKIKTLASTPSGKSERPKFLLSVNGTSEPSNSPPPGRFKCLDNIKFNSSRAPVTTFLNSFTLGIKKEYKASQKS